MSISRAEIAGAIIAILGVGVMGVLAFTGPYHAINKTPVKTIAVRVKIIPNKVTIGEYVPNTITVHAGQTIEFTNTTNTDHTVTASDDSFDSGNIAAGASWQFTPNSIGTFPFGCSYHPLMRGTIVVLR